MRAESSQPEPRLWTAPFVGVMAVNGLTSLNFLLLMTFMTGYAVERFGVGEAQAGLAASSFVIGALVTRVFVGKYTDIFGRKRMLVLSAVVLLAGSLGYFVADSYAVLVVVRLVQGAAFGAVNNVTNTVAMALMPKDRKGEGTGWFTLSLTIGQALGPALGLWLVANGSINAVFLTGVGLCAAVALISAALPVKQPKISAAERAELTSWRFDRILEPKALPMGLMAFLLIFPYSGILTFMSGYAAEVGLTAYSSLCFIVYAVTLAVSRPLVGALLDRFSDNAIVVPAFIPYLLGVALLALDLGVAGYFGAAICLAVGYGSLTSLMQTIAVRETPARREPRWGFRRSLSAWTRGWGSVRSCSGSSSASGSRSPNCLAS
ncbi:MFS transporter [Gulosibacter molinativorax]|uniref:MFS transporter n=1 Tax=Gulosibacter molinativorax TaxID=256821 RepID=A0ABT7C5F9_9MICO|nr:MFS transporter [Gulosibacter molinativorax]MDJ1370433.1 MFS transporter [Gulosibacter molinativorax]QUY61346.1 Hypotetical protein [Gulosibacter molinativorax]